MSRKRGGGEIIDVESAATKQEKVFRSIKPDLAVVVGGKEFQEYSQHLCYSCEYFDNALRSGMKESWTKRFEFSDKDPKEWELVRSMLVPMGVRPRAEDVSIVLPWFDKLCCYEGVKECDKTLEAHLRAVFQGKFNGSASYRNGVPRPTGNIRPLTEGLDLSLRFPGMGQSKQCCFELISCILTTNRHLLKDMTDRATIASLMTTNEEFRKTCWAVMNGNLPAAIAAQHPSADESLLENGVWAGLILSAMVEAPNGYRY
ncbi:expressed unknown protein [Seminavis robusta]|uniref:BTB domain-containing protein n=1 Tax=Seminavis robusta TaxID=568900 RepID=A0A9N8D905_9STRA|nr:expressed unknown protein [Seminavis robusta]|eukprot:Sro20_g013790.1 n/a (259) ;mRNA; r:1611-2387